MSYVIFANVKGHLYFINTNNRRCELNGLQDNATRFRTRQQAFRNLPWLNKEFPKVNLTIDTLVSIRAAK